ncbi:MAG: hypothetical protein WAV47_27870 [Blastocatellia bacterium]
MRRKIARKRATESLEEKNPQPYVVPKSEVRDLMGSLNIHKLSTVAARFQSVADLTCGAFEDSKDNLEQAELTLIKRLAREGNGRLYRRIMAAILTGIGQGRHGINAANLTASLAVQMAFRWSPEYRIALDSYRHRLRRQSLGRPSRDESINVSRPPKNQITKIESDRIG